MYFCINSGRCVPRAEGVTVALGVSDGVGEGEAVGIGVGEGPTVGVGVAVGADGTVGVGVGVGAGGDVGVEVGVGVGVAAAGRKTMRSRGALERPPSLLCHSWLSRHAPRLG